MSATGQEIRFYFDFISPYAFLGWLQLQQLPEVEIRPVPVLFAGLLNQWGHKGPAEIPPKRLFTFKDALRKAHRQGVALQLPIAHPFNPLLPLRLATRLDGDPRQGELITAIFEAFWCHRRDITDPQTLVRLLWHDEAEQRQALLESSLSPENKEKLKQNTADAIADGVFGVPTYLLGEELFWGSDQMDFLRAHLEGRDPVQSIDAKIEDLPVGQHRRGK